jgi:alpha-1,2-mannosyltransferase
VSLATPSQEHERTRINRRRLAILGAVTVVVAAAHVWYGNRHDFFDLLVYREAMRWWDAGNPLYGFIQPDDTQGRLGFTYPPFAGYLLRPLAWITPAQTIWVYSVIAVGAFAASIWWLIRPMAGRRGPAWFVFALAFVLSTTLEPIREAFTFGQINVVLWALILLDLLVLLPRGSRFTGVSIGLATAIKLVPGIFILYLLVTRRWIAAAVAAGTTVAATGVAAAVAPRESWTYFTERMLGGEGIGQLHYTFNQSVMGTLARLAYPDQPSRIVWLVLSLALLGYGLWRAARLAGAGDEVAAIAVVGIVGSLVSPVTWVHHIFWFVPALVVLVDSGRRALVAFAAVIYLTVTVSVLALWEFTFDRPGGVIGFVLANWFVWLMLALLVVLPARDPRAKRAQTSSDQVAVVT